MVIGIGFDLADVEFWEKRLKGADTGLLSGTFTEDERSYARDHPKGEAHGLAARFAAKEAVIKAFGATRIDQPPLSSRLDMREIELCNDSHGRPYLRLHGRSSKIASRLGVRHFWVTISHARHVAGATVVMEG